MTAAQATPGPWRNHGGLGYEDLIIGADAAPIAVVSKHNKHAVGNAALITAAPQLLAALRAAKLALNLNSLYVVTDGKLGRAALTTDDQVIAEEIDALLAQIDAALAIAGAVP